MRSVDCVLLAAGSSERMGKPKLLIPLGRGTIFEASLANYAASRLLGSVLAVVPGWIGEFDEIAERLETERTMFIKMDKPCAMSDSLRAGWDRLVRGSRPDGIMISLADKPLVTARTIDAVAQAYREGGCDVCVPSFRGAWGHPVIVDRSLGGEIRDLRGDRGAMAVLEAHRDRLREVPVESDEILFDVDGEGDLADLEARLAAKGLSSDG
jgi:molybdenum cofactor cytidylyltransferase